MDKVKHTFEKLALFALLKPSDKKEYYSPKGYSKELVNRIAGSLALGIAGAGIGTLVGKPFGLRAATLGTMVGSTAGGVLGDYWATRDTEKAVNIQPAIDKYIYRKLITGGGLFGGMALHPLAAAPAGILADYWARRALAD